MANLYGGDTEIKTRVSLLDIYPRGTAAAGNSPDQVGSGTHVPLVIKVPTTQSVDAIELQLANKTITAAGGNPVLWSVTLAGQGGYLGGVAGGGECCISFPLTAAQIIAMGTTAITIVPAPGTGFAILVRQISVELDLTSTAFTGGGVVHFYYHGQTTEIMSASIAAATVQGSAGTSVYLLEPVATSGGSVVTPAVGIDITNATAPFAAGTGTAIVTIWYNVLPL